MRHHSRALIKIATINQNASTKSARARTRRRTGKANPQFAIFPSAEGTHEQAPAPAKMPLLAGLGTASAAKSRSVFDDFGYLSRRVWRDAKRQRRTSAYAAPHIKFLYQIKWAATLGWEIGRFECRLAPKIRQKTHE